MKINKEEILKSLELSGIYNKNESHAIEILDNEKVITGCNSCGKCCRNRNDILLKPADIYNMSKELNLKPIDIITKYCEVYIGENSKLPIISIKFREDFFGNTTTCPFLKKVKDNVYHCRIHNSKPNVCRIYPLGRVSCGEKDLIYFQQNTTCIDKEEQKEYTFEEWLGKDYKIHEEYFNAYYNLLNYIIEKIDLENLWEIAEKRKENKTIMSLLLSILYIPNIDLNFKESLEEYNLRIEDIDKIISIFYETGYKKAIKK